MMGIEAITGRYVTVEVEGRALRIYFEEAGQGRPVLCLHTAGADTRQWRHLMNDAEVTAANRLIAFDMPWHGKSLPPEGFQTEEYLLTTEAYIETILAVVDALGLERPVLAGCSMGGRIALQLAALHPGRFSGFIAIEASEVTPSAPSSAATRSVMATLSASPSAGTVNEMSVIPCSESSLA